VLGEHQDKLQKRQAAEPYDFGRNDLQPVASAICPDVHQALKVFADSGLNGKMTGSGSAVFARCTPGTSLNPVPNHWQVRKCSNLDVHPLKGWASSDS